MTLTQKLEKAMLVQDCLPNTRNTYHFWVKLFYKHCRKPGSEWRQEDVRAWMVHLGQQNFSHSARKQALCAIKFVFDHVLKSQLGWLDLPPMPCVHQTLRTIP